MNKMSTHQSSVPAGLSCQRALRVAILSALGAYSLGLHNSAQADYQCLTGPISPSEYLYFVCGGDDGEDKNNEKDGHNGPVVSMTQSGIFNADSGTQVWLFP